ncbi:14669_t:CDS:2 [Acaulospora morrowiae]|uniref:14669_t:CDS:1 n=1 Tax=Acaulospora morrowiae TaxID=94023 RepID=A0A9N9B7E7_9GLOM|nr:14669_t:CDS:2 [Acaulospora morrowiae]
MRDLSSFSRKVSKSSPSLHNNNRQQPPRRHIIFPIQRFSQFNFFLLLLLIQHAFAVTPRWGHTATLVNNTIYFLGGKSNIDLFITDFLALDVSTGFSVSSPPWLSLNFTDAPPLSGHTATPGGANNSKIIVFGGSLIDSVYNFSTVVGSLPKLYTYDPSNDSWLVPTISTGITFPNGPPRRYQHSAVTLGVQTNSKWIVNITDGANNEQDIMNSNMNGKMILYGGYVDASTGSPTANALSDFWGLDTIDMDGWIGYPMSNNSPGRLYKHTASVINETKMVILGGIGEDGVMRMDTVYVYDFVESVWSIHSAAGQVPAPRRDHSAVVFESSLIIYGGADLNGTTIYGDVAKLNTSTWKWSAQPTINTPLGRFQHTATLVGINMIVGFGKTNVNSSTADKNIYIFNILNWTWVDTYIPTTLVNHYHIKPSSSSSSISRDMIIGIAVGGSVILLLLLMALIYCLNRRYKIFGFPCFGTQENSPPQSPPNGDSDLERNDDMINEDEQSLHIIDNNPMVEHHGSFSGSIRQPKSLDLEFGDEINTPFTPSESPSSSSPVKFLQLLPSSSDTNTNNNDFKIETVMASSENLLGAANPVASQTPNPEYRTSSPVSGAKNERRSVKFSETNTTIAPTEFGSSNNSMESLSITSENGNRVIENEDDNQAGPSNSWRASWMNLGSMSNFSGLRRNSFSFIFRRNSNNSRNNESGSAGRRWRSNSDGGGNRIRGRGRSFLQRRRSTGDEETRSRSSIDSVNIRNIGMGLDVQHHRGDSVVVPRRELRVVNPDVRDESEDSSSESGSSAEAGGHHLEGE